MTPDLDAAINALALVVAAVRASAKLQTWFDELAGLSDTGRRDAVNQAIREMRAQRASEELVAAFGLLSHPSIFAATLSALHECRIRV